MYERNRLYFERFKLVAAIIPPLQEQREIATGINVQTITLLAAITRTEREIALLREYRTTLTAEVVTGKLDVREAAKRLPAEATDFQPVEDLPDNEDVPEETDA